jgi:hypothetical protein
MRFCSIKGLQSGTYTVCLVKSERVPGRLLSVVLCSHNCKYVKISLRPSGYLQRPGDLDWLILNWLAESSYIKDVSGLKFLVWAVQGWRSCPRVYPSNSSTNMSKPCSYSICCYSQDSYLMYVFASLVYSIPSRTAVRRRPASRRCIHMPVDGASAKSFPGISLTLT